MQKLRPTQLKEAGAARNVWAVNIEPGITLEILKNPQFWSHVSSRFTPGDHIEVLADDGTFFAEFLVITASRLWAKVSVLRFVELTEDAPSPEKVQNLMDGFEIKYGSHQSKWRVIRKDDKEVMKEGLGSKKEAEQWLTENINTVS